MLTGVESSHEPTDVVLAPWEDLGCCDASSKDEAERFVMCVEAVNAPHMWGDRSMARRQIDSACRICYKNPTRG